MNNKVLLCKKFVAKHCSFREEKFIFIFLRTVNTDEYK